MAVIDFGKGRMGARTDGIGGLTGAATAWEARPVLPGTMALDAATGAMDPFAPFGGGSVLSVLSILATVAALANSGLDFAAGTGTDLSLVATIGNGFLAMAAGLATLAAGLAAGFAAGFATLGAGLTTSLTALVLMALMTLALVFGLTEIFDFATADLAGFLAFDTTAFFTTFFTAFFTTFFAAFFATFTIFLATLGLTFGFVVFRATGLAAGFLATLDPRAAFVPPFLAAGFLALVILANVFSWSNIVVNQIPQLKRTHATKHWDNQAKNTRRDQLCRCCGGGTIFENA